MHEIKNKRIVHSRDIFDIVFSACFLGVVLLILTAIAISAFDKRYEGKAYPNVFVGGKPFGDKTRRDVQTYWEQKNSQFANTTFTLVYDNHTATLSASELNMGYDATLSATQTYLVGRSRMWLSNLYNKFLRKVVNLTPYFRWDTQAVTDKLQSISETTDIPAEDALFTFNKNRVTAFRPSKSGRKVNKEKAHALLSDAFETARQTGERNLTITIPIDVVAPAVTTDQVNTYGIKDHIGRGYSEFSGSIPGRIHNVALAASRLNGILIKPGETFSFNDTIGDISAATGYQSAYIIKEGRTVLGDGGGVCQVSTTIFRAAMAAGLPIVERHAHAYRVHYYEEGGFKPGMDATVFGPTYDLKFTNDTPGYILIQTTADLSVPSLTFDLYGTGDGRTAKITNQKLWDVTPPPPDLFQDDPTLARGVTKQVDFSAWGAKASFEYIVTRAGQTIQNATFLSNFRPWQAIYLKGTM